MLTAEDPLPHRPRRVLVAGVSGVGKTTFAARIAEVTGGRHTEIDALYHGPGWAPRATFLDDVRRFIAGEDWTTEWQYTAARPLLAARADLLVWLDFPFATTTLPRVTARTLRRRLRREELWNGNVEPPLRTFFTDPEHIVRWAIRTRGNYRARIPLLEADEPDLIVVRLRTPREAERWLRGSLADAVGDEGRGTGPSPQDTLAATEAAQMTDVRPRVIAVRQGAVAPSGSWLYVWVDVADRSIAYVGATGFDPELRAYVHLTSDDPDAGRVRAQVPRFDERDFEVLAFPLPADCPRPAAKQALIARLAELGHVEAGHGAAGCGVAGDGAVRSAEAGHGPAGGEPLPAGGEPIPAVVERIVRAVRDHIGAAPLS